MLSVTGLAAQAVYARGLLDRLRIKPSFFQREEYKSAASFLTNRAATPAEREATRSVLASLSGQVVRGIAEGRHLSEREASGWDGGQAVHGGRLLACVRQLHTGLPSIPNPSLLPLTSTGA